MNSRISTNLEVVLTDHQTTVYIVLLLLHLRFGDSNEHFHSIDRSRMMDLRGSFFRCSFKSGLGSWIVNLNGCGRICNI